MEQRQVEISQDRAHTTHGTATGRNQPGTEPIQQPMEHNQVETSQLVTKSMQPMHQL